MPLEVEFDWRGFGSLLSDSMAVSAGLGVNLSTVYLDKYGFVVTASKMAPGLLSGAWRVTGLPATLAPIAKDPGIVVLHQHDSLMIFTSWWKVFGSVMSNSASF